MDEKKVKNAVPKVPVIVQLKDMEVGDTLRWDSEEWNLDTVKVSTYRLRPKRFAVKPAEQWRALLVTRVNDMEEDEEQ